MWYMALFSAPVASPLKIAKLELIAQSQKSSKHVLIRRKLPFIMETVVAVYSYQNFNGRCRDRTGKWTGFMVSPAWPNHSRIIPNV